MARDLDGKVFLITGGTEGIGKAATRELAKRGATIALVGRNKEKTERVATELRELGGAGELGGADARVEVFIADMSSLAEVRRVAAEFKAKYDRLDVLVNNAGAVFLTHQKSVDGFEMTFALNHLGYFLLTHELDELLRKTPGARVISTSSGAHNRGKIDFDVIARRPANDAGFGAYCDSKLANILFTRELAARMKGSDVTVHCFHPGFVETGFGKNNKGVFASLIAVGASLFARTPEKGAETLVWLTTEKDIGSVNGEYYFDKKVTRTNKHGSDRALATKFWAYSAELCGLDAV